MTQNFNPEKNIAALLKDYTPIMRYDKSEDFSKWQSDARAKLRELLGIDLMHKCEPNFKITEKIDCGDHTKIYFAFNSEENYTVPCCLAVPKSAKAKMPLMICLQGHSNGMHISLGVPKFSGDDGDVPTGHHTRFAMDNGYCALAIEQRYMGQCGGDEKGPGCLANGRGQTASPLTTLLMGRSAIGERVFDISCAIDVVCENFDVVDADDISCIGSSGGGTATYYAACIDERIKNAVASCAVCTYLDSIVNLFHCPCNYVPSVARYFDMGDLGGLIAPRALLIYAGEEDPIFPIDGVKKCYKIIKELYNKAGADDKVILATAKMPHRFNKDVAYNALNKVR